MDNLLPPETEQKRVDLLEHFFKLQRQMLEAFREGRTQPAWMHRDLTMPQFKILFLLSTGPQRMSDIADKLDKNLSTATGVTDRLVEQGLVKREEDPKDRRVVRVLLTTAGRELYESILNNEQQHTNRILTRLSLAELEIVVQGMQIMARVAHEEADQGSAASHNSTGQKD